MAEGLHGDMSQHQRDVAMNRFRNGSTSILIATDVAARGIDVDNVEAVINYDLPQDIEYSVHRIGRTGRAGKTGRSFTFVGAREMYRIREIERICKTTIQEKKLPGAAKVLKAKADKYLNNAWELHEHEDIELMKQFLQRKLEVEECDAMTLAAAMLKYQVGDKGPEIVVEKEPERRGRRFGERRGEERGDRRERDSRGREGRRFEGRKGEGRSVRRSREERRSEGKDGVRGFAKRERTEDRRSENRRPKDVRMDGSGKGIEFLRPKRKKAPVENS